MDWGYTQNYIEISNVQGYIDDQKVYTDKLPEVILSDSLLEIQEMHFYGKGRGSRKAISPHSFSSFDFISKTELENITSKLHKHDYYELILPIRMPLEMQIESRLCLLKEGEVCLLNRSTRHAEHFQANQQVLYIVLSPAYMEFWPREEGTSIPRPFRQLFEKGRDLTGISHKDYILSSLLQTEGKTKANEIIRNIWQELQDKRPGYPLFVRGLLLCLLSLLSDNNLYHSEYINLGQNTGFELAQSIKKLLDTNIRKTTKNDLAQKLSYNGDYLSQVFFKYFNCTIAEYNRKLCLRQMAHLLLTTNKSVDAICRQLGFVNRTNIYRQFREIYGCTPSEFRRRSL